MAHATVRVSFSRPSSRSGTPAVPRTVRDNANEGKATNVATQDEWSVSCRDLAGRRRDLTVFISGGRVVVVAPPGEAAVLEPLDVGRLRAALRDAVVAVGQHSRE